MTMADYADEPAARGMLLIGRIQGLSDSLAMAKRLVENADSSSAKVVLEEIMAWHRDALEEAEAEIKLLDTGDW